MRIASNVAKSNKNNDFIILISSGLQLLVFQNSKMEL